MLIKCQIVIPYVFTKIQFPIYSFLFINFKALYFIFPGTLARLGRGLSSQHESTADLTPFSGGAYTLPTCSFIALTS